MANQEHLDREEDLDNQDQTDNKDQEDHQVLVDPPEPLVSPEVRDFPAREDRLVPEDLQDHPEQVALWENLVER